MNIEYSNLFKICLIGDSASGKTSIIKQFVDEEYTLDTSSTIGIDFKIVSFNISNSTYIKMQIWDTCGSERFKSLTASFLKSCSAFILVFDLTRKKTLLNIECWINTVKENTIPKFMILIGNKSDLKEQREVNNNDVLEICKKYSLNYIESSAKSNENIEIIFKIVVNQLLNTTKIETTDKN